MSLKIVRVNSLPGTLKPNTIYLTAMGPSEVRVTVVGNTAQDVRSTVTRSEVGGDINASGAVFINSAVTQSKTYTDDAIASAIAGLDPSSAPFYVNTVAERNALTLETNAFVVVGDATGDATVASGSALYFYNSSTTSFMKLAEYESMDLVIPNKNIIENLSEIDGELTYKGEKVGTVMSGVHDW